MKRLRSLVVLTALVISACGGSEVSVSESTTDAPEPTLAPTAPAASTTTAQTVDAPELGGTSWAVTNYSLPSGAITNVWKTDVTIAFSEEGIVSGSAGCNDYEGNWSVSGGYDEFVSGQRDPNDGQILILDTLTWTEIACEDEAIMEQEGEILDLLQRAGRWLIREGNFNLRDADGFFLFETEPA